MCKGRYESGQIVRLSNMSLDQNDRERFDENSRYIVKQYLEKEKGFNELLKIHFKG